MRSARLIRCPVCLILAILASPGCQLLHDYKPVPVLVLDAESKKPLADVAVRISYPMTRSSFVPYDSAEITGQDGIALLKAAPFGEHVLLLEAKAARYMLYTQDLSPDAIRQMKAANLFEPAERKPPAFVVEMVAEPRFYFELVLPTGYRGVVKAVVNLKDDVPWKPGQRGFSFEVSALGEVQLTGPTILSRYTPLFRARYVNGAALDEKMDALQVGFRWLKREGNEEYFVVGTQPIYDHYRRTLLRTLPQVEESSPAGGRGERRGGRDWAMQTREP